MKHQHFWREDSRTFYGHLPYTYVLNYQRVNPIKSHLKKTHTPFSYGFPIVFFSSQLSYGNILFRPLVQTPSQHGTAQLTPEVWPLHPHVRASRRSRALTNGSPPMAIFWRTFQSFPRQKKARYISSIWNQIHEYSEEYGHSEEISHIISYFHIQISTIQSSSFPVKKQMDFPGFSSARFTRWGADGDHPALRRDAPQAT